MYSRMVIPVHPLHVTGSSEAYADGVFDHGRVLLTEATAAAKEAASPSHRCYSSLLE